MRKYCLLSLLLIASLLEGQELKTANTALQPYSDLLNKVLTAPNAAAKTTAVNDLMTIERHLNQFSQYASSVRFATNDDLAKEVQQKLANLVEQSRLDIQSNSGPGASGSTSAVAKAGLSSIL